MTAKWSPLRTVAEFNQQGWSVELDPSKPTSPLVLKSSQGVRWEALAIKPMPQHSMRAEEIYIREQDLIARFGQHGKDAYSFQVDWRLFTPPPGFEVGIEIWISLQTLLLDSAPKIEVSSQAIESWKAFQHQQLVEDNAVQDQQQGWSASQAETVAALLSSTKSGSCLWLIEPRDLQQVSWKTKLSDKHQTAELFGAFLEKGVIRRARVQLLVTHQSVSTVDVQRAYGQLIESELPLTT